ncbi:MAG TPA: site-2 protease family protein [Polyangiaceae bacterium]|nr:site-2 protease family protein [Polyangiaceae bacterium]
MASSLPKDSSSPPRNTTTTGTGLHVGRLFGVDVSLDATLLVVFFLVATSLGRGTLPRWHPDWSPALVWAVSIGAAVAFLSSVLLHELSHAVVAKAQGTKVRGITLFMLGGIAQIDEEPATPGREFWMAIVGPFTSVAVGIGASAAGAWALHAEHPGLVQSAPVQALRSAGAATTLLLWLGPVNLSLGVFNLVPGFPLDGGRVLRSILWALSKNRVTATLWAGAVGSAFGWLLIAVGVLMTFGGSVRFFGSGAVQGLWLVLLGWFLASAARASRERTLGGRGSASSA